MRKHFIQSTRNPLNWIKESQVGHNPRFSLDIHFFKCLGPLKIPSNPKFIQHLHFLLVADKTPDLYLFIFYAVTEAKNIYLFISTS